MIKNCMKSIKFEQKVWAMVKLADLIYVRQLKVQYSRRKIRLIESNAKCCHLKIDLQKRTLRRVFNQSL
jgi:hypothetical protein